MKTLQQIAEKENLNVINVEGKEYIVGNMDNFYEIAEKHHLRINVNDVNDEDIVAWADTFLLQVVENLREDPNDKYQQMHYAVLNAIKERLKNKQ